jgi:hypothetical protein
MEGGERMLFARLRLKNKGEFGYYALLIFRK